MTDTKQKLLDMEARLKAELGALSEPASKALVQIEEVSMELRSIRARAIEEYSTLSDDRRIESRHPPVLELINKTSAICMLLADADKAATEAKVLLSAAHR